MFAEYLKARWAEASTKRNLLRLIMSVVVLIMMQSGWSTEDVQKALDMIKQVLEIMAAGGAVAATGGVLMPDKKPAAPAEGSRENG